MISSKLKFVILLTCVTANATQAQQSAPARIVLPSQAAVSNYEVRLGAVANISCDQPVLLRKLQEIDIADIGAGQPTTAVKLSFINIRLQLAGIERDQFRLSGAKTCQIEYTPPGKLTDADVEQAGTIVFHESLGGSLKDIRVRMKAPFVASLPSYVRDTPGLRAVALPPTRGDLGEVSTLVQLWDGERLVLSKLTRFEVLQKQTVAITLASFSRNEPITLSNLRLEDRFVSKAQDQPVEKDLRNKIARRDIRPGQMLSLNDLRPAPSAARAVSIKARDTVRVEAVSGRLRVRLTSAVATQSGSIGDMIQFKNLSSGIVRSGKVAGPGLIQVQLQ